MLASSIAASLAGATNTALYAQPYQEAPVVPSSSIGPVTNASTFSILGVTALPEAGASVSDRNVLWFAATQPIGRIGGVRLSAIGYGFYRPTDIVGSRDATEGTLSLRALARIAGMRTWTAVSYGRSAAEGSPGNPNESLMPTGGTRPVLPKVTDTAYSRRVDIGTLARAELGLLTTSGQVEFSFGVSVERATRVTTQRLNIIEEATVEEQRDVLSTSALERRDLATAMASANFRTGATNWLLSVSSPIVNWANASSAAPRPLRTPAVASLAFMHPMSAWLSVVGAASTNATTVGTYALRDGRSESSRKDFAPVVALGVRIARFSVRNRPGIPTGILAVEARTIGLIDLVTAENVAVDSTDVVESGRELVRVRVVVDAPRAESVELMGDATAWNITTLARGRDGKWRGELRVTPGMHRISMRADGGSWMAPPGWPMGTDDYGSRVGLLVVKLRNY